MSTRTLITGGTVLVGPVLTGHFARADVLVVDGRIAEIGDDLDASGAQVLDAADTFVLPGFVDAHAHLWEASMRGICADWDIIDFAWGIRFNHAGLHTPEETSTPGSSPAPCRPSTPGRPRYSTTCTPSPLPRMPTRPCAPSRTPASVQCGPTD